MKSKRSILLFLALAVVIVITVLILLFASQNNAATQSKNIDLSDIENMNIGAEMPDILYADDIAVLEGTCGVIVFDLNTEKIINRISYEEIHEKGIIRPVVSVSKDGKNIFISDLESNHICKYNIRSNKMTAVAEIDAELYSPTIINVYDEKYNECFDLSYIIGGGIIPKEDSFLYLRAKSDWSMKSLQIVECDNQSKIEIKVIDVFDLSEDQ